LCRKQWLEPSSLESRGISNQGKYPNELVLIDWNQTNTLFHG